MQDIEEHPNKYISGFLVAPGIGQISKVFGAATSSSVVIQKSGSITDLISEPINDITGCY